MMKLFNKENNLPDRDQMCKCGHPASKHVRTDRDNELKHAKSWEHPSTGSTCNVVRCKCSSFSLDVSSF